MVSYREEWSEQSSNNDDIPLYFIGMLKLFDLKKPGADNGGSGTPRSGPSAADLRIQKGY